MKKTVLEKTQMILYIFLLAFFAVLAIPVCWNGASKDNGGILVFFMSLALCFGFVLIKHVCEKINDSYYKWLVAGSWVLLLVLQMLFLTGARNLLRYDALNVYDEAVSFFYDGGISPDTKDGYFSRYANNYPITILTFLFLKIGRMFRIVAPDFHNGIYYLQWINLVMIDITVLFGFLFVRDLLKKKSLAVCYMLFAVISPTTYVWIPYYYSNTLAMPFYMGALWLIGRWLFKEDSPEGKKISKKNICMLMIAGVAGYLGFAVRATVGITLIALFLGCLVGLKKIKKEHVIGAGIIVLGFFIGMAAMKPVTNKYVQFDYSASAFPVSHWLMMAASGDGGYNKKDEVFTSGFATAGERSEATKEELGRRLSELGADGVVKLAFRKMFSTFCDGTADYVAMLSISDDYNGLYRYVYGDRNLWLTWYMQAVYLASVMSAVFCAVLLVAGRKFHPCSIVIINMLGAFLFYMLWEAGSIYSMSFFPLFYMAIAGGMDFNVPVLEKCSVKVLYVMPIIIWMVILAVNISRSAIMSKDKTLIYQVNQYIFETDHYQPCSDGITLRQSFKSCGDFEYIAIQARNPLGAQNDSVYRIVLEDGNK